MKKYDLTAPQIDMLVYLSLQESEGKTEESTLSAISDYFGVKHTSSLHVLKLLEKKGYICRKKEEKSRKNPFFVTEKARGAVREDKKNLEYVKNIMFAGMTQEECSALEKYLNRIYDNLKNGNFE